MVTKAQLITVVALVVLGGAIAYIGNVGNIRGVNPVSGVFCTMDAKLCPDGSYVGRTGPDCEFTQCPSGATNTIAIGASATINDTTIGVLELLEDSRCPADVQCIWAGTVRVRAAIDAYNRDFTFTISEPQVVGNATITLVSVIPAQKFSTQTVPLSGYRFTFTVVPKPASGVACTMDARLCPDGSYVGRTGPNCEFLCPSPTHNSGVRGTVMLGPVCPVMRDPPDPNCADRGYATQISVFRASNNNLVATAKSDAQGNFEVALAPGNYVVSAEGGQTLPRCSPVNVTVSPNQYAQASIQCDTGIR
ncbi:MAG: hypothetical protein NUV88_03530 [Candidatus Kaiserbacteria bacterium]|nr:hypothetical protein [Candidatus Kaiserbacteria bacterium]